jgi:hypothetical protein
MTAPGASATGASRLVLAAAVLIAAAVAIAAVGVGAPSGAGAPPIELTGATRALSIHTSRPNRAVVKGRNLAPGQSRRGKVTVRINSPARVSLTADRFGQDPGPRGGKLLRALRIRVKRSSVHPGARRTVYQGRLANFGTRKLGRWQPHRRYTYKVRVVFAPSDAAQDSLQGARTRFRFVWRATAMPPPE